MSNTSRLFWHTNEDFATWILSKRNELIPDKLYLGQKLMDDFTGMFPDYGAYGRTKLSHRTFYKWLSMYSYIAFGTQMISIRDSSGKCIMFPESVGLNSNNNGAPYIPGDKNIIDMNSIEWIMFNWFDDNIDKSNFDKVILRAREMYLDEIEFAYDRGASEMQDTIMEIEKYSSYKDKLEDEKRIRKNASFVYKKKTDPVYRLRCNIRSMITNALKKKQGIKSKKTQEMLGCTFIELRCHIESQFEDWMNWDNYGKYNGEYNYGWDIDHIIPLSTAETEDDVIRLNHFTNLRPLCSKVNRYVKRDKTDYEV